MLVRQSAALFVSALCFIVCPGCGSDSSEATAPLAAWSSTWRATETYMRSSAFGPVAEAIHEMRSEYTVQEIQEIFAAGHDVDFSDLEVTADSLTFKNAKTLLCGGRYAADAADVDRHHHDGGEHDEHEATFAFQLVETRGGDCSDYATVAFGSEPHPIPDTDDEYAHFHLQAGTPRPAPWSPAVLTPMAPERFTEIQLANASAYAQGLPAK